MKSRAVVVGRFPDYTVREFEVPACGAEGLIVKVAAAPFGRRGLVDLRLDGAMDGRLRDFIPGGEIIGRVVSAPPAAAEAWKVSEGDMVYIEPNIVCGFCKPCLTGNYSVCREQLRYGSFPLAERPELLAGGFSEYVSVLPNSRVHKLPEDLPLESAVLLGTAERALRAVIKRGEGGLGKRMLVLGLDLFAVLACLAAEGVGMESAEIYAPDALETDRAAAEACGCVFTGEVAAGGYDIVLVSDAARENVEWAWRAPCPQGRLVFAVPPELADLPAGQLLHHEMTVTGVGNASWDYERALRLVVQNAKRLSAVRTRWIDAADFSAAVEAAEEKMTAAAARWDL